MQNARVCVCVISIPTDGDDDGGFAAMAKGWQLCVGGCVQSLYLGP